MSFSPTLNPSPIKREGLQNIVALPFPHFGGKGLGDGGRFVNATELIPIQARVEGVAHAIAQEVEAQHRDHDGDAGEKHQMW